MSNHYPTPVSIAGSFDETHSSRKRSKTNNDEQSLDLAQTHASKDERAMAKLLRHSRKSVTPQPDGAPSEEKQFCSIGLEQEQLDVERDLCVWGYLLSNASEYLSFLLSKESRCGKKNDAWHSKHYGNAAEGVTLKDYNGDNLASSGYLIGRNSECDVVIDLPSISEHHCVIFKIHVAVGNNGETPTDECTPYTSTAVEQRVFLQDISGRGTWVNSKLLKRNEILRLKDHDTFSLTSNGPTWTFRSTQAVHLKSFADRFEIGRTLGRGHFAEVFEVMEKSTKQRFAAKMIKKLKVKDDKLFLQEIGLLMSCTHPLITCIRDVFDVGSEIYLILEFAAGGELFDRIIQKGHFSEDETRTLFRQLFAALKYLHEHSIVHRDIKPENILLSSTDSLEIRLADFGLAKIIGNSSSTTTLAGTPSYIPPEMLAAPQSGASVPYSKKVDSWSAGVVLYICLCGFPPFSPELAPPPLKTQIKEGKFHFQSPYWDDISDEAIDLVRRLLTVDPQRRYSISQALEHPFMTGEPSNIASENIDETQHPNHAPRGIKRARTMIQESGRPII